MWHVPPLALAEEVVAATTYVETGQKTGNVVLTLDGFAPLGPREEPRL